MKRIQIFLSTGAVALGLIAVVATAAPRQHFTNYWFDTQADGTPTVYDPNGAQCSQPNGDYCSKEYSASQINFDSHGNPVSVKIGQENQQIAAEHLGL
jgi:hypothetical protein